MKLGIGALSLPSTDTGIGVLTENVLKGLLDHFPSSVGYVAREPERSLVSDRISVLTNRPFRAGWAGMLDRLYVYQVALRRRLIKHEVTLFYSTVHEGLLSPPCPQVLTLLDLIPLKYKSAHPKLRLFFKTQFRWLLRCSRGVICISETTRRDLLAHYRRVDPARVAVVHLGYDPQMFSPKGPAEAGTKWGLGRYFLAVGSAAPTKNLVRTVAAFARLGNSAGQLVLVGRRDLGDWQQVNAAISHHNLEGRVKVLGTVSSEELARLYSGAIALAFPSLAEGFGLPALEAMACGCPVIVSQAGPFPEVCGDAALYVDPHSEESIANAMERVGVDRDYADGLRHRGIDRASQFTWSVTVRKLAAVLQGFSLS